MLKIGTQTKNVVYDQNPDEGFRILKKSGFDCCDFSLNSYLLNTDLYNEKLNCFFDRTDTELETFFAPHKKAALETGIQINQMHMPYPTYVPNGKKELNDYLLNVVAPKSMKICKYFDCRYIVVHGFKLARNLGCEEAEWQKTEMFLNTILPMAKEMDIVICVENIYTGVGNHIIEGPCCNIHKAVERIDRINDKHGAEVLGFCFDTGHAKLVRLDFEDFITKLDYRLKVLHIHDNDGVSDLHQIPFTFTKTRENTSSTDWDGFIRGLRNIKYNGVLSFETAPVLTAFPNEMKKDTLQFISKIGRYFSDKITRKEE